MSEKVETLDGHSPSDPNEGTRGSGVVGQDRVLSGGFVIFLLAVAALFVYLAVSTEGFLTLRNLRAILRIASLVGIVAVAMTPIMISGNFVSLGIQESAMAGMLGFIALVGMGWPPLVATVVVMVGLVLLGIFQAWLIVGGLNPVITTLAAGAVVFGVVALITGGGIVHMGERTVWWGSAAIAGVPIEVLAFILFTGLVTALSSKTVLGRQTLLVGANRETARITGISFTKVTLAAFVVFSVGLGLAAVLNGAAFAQGTLFSFSGLTIDSIAAILVGGTAIQGGRGSPFNSAVGAVVVSVATNIMTLNALSTGARLTMQGAIVVGVVVVLQILRSRREGQ